MRILIVLLLLLPCISRADCQARLNRARSWRLTRDLMPDIFARDGNQVEIRRATKKIFEKLIFKKLNEEVAEFEKDPSAEELADVKEVVLTIVKHFGLNHADEQELAEVWTERLREHGFDDAEVEHIRLLKRQKKGGFEAGFMIRAIPARQRALQSQSATADSSAKTKDSKK